MSAEAPLARRSAWSGLFLAQAFALAFFAACVWRTLDELAVSFTNNPVLPSLSIQSSLGPVVTWQLAIFAAAAWLVHAMLGLCAYGLARLTEASIAPHLAIRRSLLVAGWSSLLIGIVLIANASWYPASLFADGRGALQQRWAGLMPVENGALALVLITFWMCARAYRQSVAKARPITIAGAALLVLSTLLLFPPHPTRAMTPPDPRRPNIILIGIDSLRNDLSLPDGREAGAPEMRQFLRGARRFTDVTSPLPRTYGAWVAILSGRHPVTTNARVNLMPRNLVHEGQTLPSALRTLGYRTIFAMDESRFANFDESYGIDQLVTPPVGAADFLLGYAGDLPLVNLVAGSDAGALLFPMNHANRGASLTYRPRHFLQRLDREISYEGPTFLTVHLTLAHWPYAWAGTDVPTQPRQYREAYARAVAEVDRQFGQVMRLLAAKGMLENAIVALLSDHGEALGGEADTVLRGTNSARDLWNSVWGHGTSVLSPHQFQVLLALRAYGTARLPGPERDFDGPASLEDLRPTLEELVTGHVTAGVDGISLVPYLADPSRIAELQPRIRFTETDFNTPRTLAGHYEVSGLVDEAATYYRLDRKTGKVEFRPERLPELLAAKQRAAMTAGTLLAVLPHAPGQTRRFLLVDRLNPSVTVLEGPPEGWPDEESRRLLQALKWRFPGEFGAATTPPAIVNLVKGL